MNKTRKEQQIIDGLILLAQSLDRLKEPDHTKEDTKSKPLVHY